MRGPFVPLPLTTLELLRIRLLTLDVCDDRIDKGSQLNARLVDRIHDDGAEGC